MSVIVRDEEGKILLLCKGADRLVTCASLPLQDFIRTNRMIFSRYFNTLILFPNSLFLVRFSVMFERLAQNGREFEDETKKHVNEYADAGLRTLILAYREISDEEYEVFDKKIKEAKNSVTADRETMIDGVTEMVEKDLILLGATAVEDKLQEGVGWQDSFDEEPPIYLIHFRRI